CARSGGAGSYYLSFLDYW
nr:immunoglobulin heavy chain junction region [Macaca mulatta]MOV37959.1 immunoglobulin heavy chain junction region [Macaca mulatta]MOV37968.1 immunoglobulin heavy chain junction region [Macaca mulatta]MOV38077.1 immunoglobulin heavy chain junction region [Macaca mulatta]MOV38107.1 immunoglobulin heavy chain junction region [Macaca mulatta]